MKPDATTKGGARSWKKNAGPKLDYSCLHEKYNEYRTKNTEKLIEACNKYGVGSAAWPLSDWEPIERTPELDVRAGKNCKTDTMWADESFESYIRKECQDEDSSKIIENTLRRRREMLEQQQQQQQQQHNSNAKANVNANAASSIKASNATKGRSTSKTTKTTKTTKARSTSR